MLRIILFIPVLQMLILVYAANYDLKNAEMVVIDQDNSTTSRELIRKFNGSPFFNIKASTYNYQDAVELLNKNKADFILEIPNNFEKNLINNNQSALHLTFDAINSTAAELASGYAKSIIGTFNQDLILELKGLSELPKQGTIQASVRFWYNENLDYKHYMAPGILVILVTVIGMFLSGMNLVKEKEIGTIEQLNVTPIKKHQLLAGKLIPFWVIGLIDLMLGLGIAILIFKLPIVGSIFTILAFTSIYLIGALGVGLLISTIAETQQQVLFIGYFFMMVFVLMGGIFTSTESMPHWAQIVNYINPISYFMEVIRMIILKGSGFGDIVRQIIYVSIFDISIVTLAIVKYKKLA